MRRNDGIPQDTYMTYLQQLGLAQVHRPDYARRNQESVWTATFHTSLPHEAYFDSWITRNAKTLIEWSGLTPSKNTDSLSLASYLSGETFEPTTISTDEVRRLQDERPKLLFDLRLTPPLSTPRFCSVCNRPWMTISPSTEHTASEPRRPYARPSAKQRRPLG